MKIPTGVYNRTQSAWNKGLTKAEDSRLDYERPTKFKKGNKVNLGRRHSEETKRKIGETNKGRRHSVETKRKMSETRMGRFHSEKAKKKMSETLRAKYASGEIKSWIKGGHLSEEHKQKIGDAHRGKYMGPDASNWQGGISFEPYDPWFNGTLKEKIRMRNNFLCQICGEKGRSVHHIDYDKKNSNEDNLITLCVSCHMKTNFSREHWEEYLNDIVMYGAREIVTVNV